MNKGFGGEIMYDAMYCSYLSGGCYDIMMISNRYMAIQNAMA